MIDSKYISLSIVLIISASIVFSDSEKYNKLKNLFLNKSWFLNFIIILIFSISSFFYYPLNSLEIEATKKAITAFVIAIFASIDLTIAPFWIIWVLSYSFDEWV
jgi:hypothetical protein